MKNVDRYLAPVIGLLVTMIVGYNAYTQSRIDEKIDSIADGIVVLKIEATRAVERLSYHEILITQNGTSAQLCDKYHRPVASWQQARDILGLPLR